ncbi:hypothetical protein [Streptomyces sp. V4I2]|uniref:hypothetical protein n=1 Tax=Streptomyces sp. V4I2 TaxID=3042280 RepID=UPI00277F12DC|nr:hypothetical protein [Streptomyces sp. V4I2]MDQ1044310.1 hypothetical protein [Streptomyces sp. V4I2]
MATKTATNTLADVIKKAEADHEKKADSYGVHLLSAREKAEQYATEAEQAEERLNGYRASLGRRADAEAVTPEAFATAFHNIERTSLLRDGAARILADLKKRPVHSDSHVAERIAEAVRAILPSDVEVIHTFADVRGDDTDNAYAIVRQITPTKFTGGREAAEVIVTVRRNPRFAAMLTRDKILNAVKSRGWYIPGERAHETHGVGVDEVRIQEAVVFSAVPILKQDPADSMVNRAASVLAFEGASRVDLGGPVTFQPISGGVRTGQFSITVRNVKHSSSVSKGERTTDVIAEVAFQTSTLSLPTGEVRQAITEAAQTLPGRFLEGVGVVVEGVAIRPVTTPSGTPGTQEVVAVKFSAKSVTA